MSESRYVDGGYADANPGWHEEDAEWKAQRIASLLREQDRLPSRLCDIGCGTGGVIAALQSEFPSVAMVGYEISPQAAALARTRHPTTDIREQDVFLSGEHFDLVMLIDVFEHVEDYIGFLRRAALMADQLLLHIPLDMSVVNVWRDGRLIAKRGDVGHLHYFSEMTALATLELAGLEVVASRFTSIEAEVRQTRGKERVLQQAMRAGYRVNASWTARILGGGSLLVLARPLIQAEGTEGV